MAMRNNFLKIYRHFGHASSKMFASPALDSFFTKSPQKEVRCCEAWRSCWPKPTSDHANTEAVLQDSRLCLRNMGVRSPPSKNLQSFLSLQAEEWMSQNSLIAFVSNCLFTQGWYHNSTSTSRHFAPNTKLWQIQRIFMHCVWVVSTPYFTVWSIHVSTQEWQCFVLKTHIVKQVISFTHVTMKSLAIPNSCSFTDLKLISWLESKRS
jgi:hypothetical protein